MTHTASETPPTIRVRISHDKTTKGWRCNETTVEITASEEQFRTYDFLLTQFLQSAHDQGLDEANRRNQVEGFSS